MPDIQKTLTPVLIDGSFFLHTVTKNRYTFTKNIFAESLIFIAQRVKR